MKIKIVSILMVSTFLSSIALAYEVTFKSSGTNFFYCEATTPDTDPAQLINITTSHITMRGLCPSATNKLGGQVPTDGNGKGGSLINVPLWKKDTQGNLVHLKDFYFTVQLDSKFKNGSVYVGSGSEVKCYYGPGSGKLPFSDDGGFC